MKTKLLFCTAATDVKRMGFAISCLDAWSRHNVEITILRPESDIYWMNAWDSFPVCTLGPIETFQKDRRTFLLDGTGDDIYILSDDDCLVSDNLDLFKALSIAEEETEFSILSLLPSNCQINPWTPEFYRPRVTREVLEHVSVGGVRFCRKHNLDWPEMKGKGYDKEHGEAIRLAGSRVGYFLNHLMVHLGENAWSVSEGLVPQLIEQRAFFPG